MKDFLRKYKFFIIFTFGSCILITFLLILLAAGPQQGAFIYQIH